MILKWWSRKTLTAYDIRGYCLKGGGDWTVCVFKRELGEKEEVVFLREGYPNAHYR